LQKSFLTILLDDKKSETFFKVFYDRLQEAQLVIKASMSATTDASLAQSMDSDAKEKMEKKCAYSSSFERKKHKMF
jgi:hypothetical protein